MSMTIPAVTRVDALEALIDVAAPFAAPTVRLFQTDITITPNLTLADLVAEEADFDGYAASGAIVWGAVHEDVAQNAVVNGPLVPFLCTGDTTPNDIYGYWLTTGGLCVGVEKFAAPISMNANLDYLAVVPQLTYGQ